MKIQSFTTAEVMYLAGPWKRKPRRCYEVLAATDAGPLLAARFTNRDRAKWFVKNALNKMKYEAMAPAYAGQPEISWAPSHDTFIFMAIDEAV